MPAYRQPQIPGLPLFIGRRRKTIKTGGKKYVAQGKTTPLGITRLARRVSSAKIVRARGG